MSYIQAENLIKQYGTANAAVMAVGGMSFNIQMGEFVAVMGESGSGKSTLLTMMGALNTPTAGNYSVDGLEVYELGQDQRADFRREFLGFVFQSFHLVPYLTLLENVMLPLATVKMSSKKKRALAEDAAETSAWWDGKPFQRILLDAPCTATGVIRRHPEIKWLRSPEQVGEAVCLQRTLLDRLWPLLETGGMLLYATCSILQEENNLQIKAFLDRTADAEEVALQADWGRAMSPGRQILPGEYEMDGFFYALLRKTS